MSWGARALAWALGAVLLSVPPTVLFHRHIVPAHRAVELDDAWFAVEEPLNVLVTGDSHARNAVAAELLPSTLSIAVPGETPVKSAHRVPWLLERHDPGVRIVVVGLDAGSFSSWKTEAFGPEAVWGRYVPFFRRAVDEGPLWPNLGRGLKATVLPWAGELETTLEWGFASRAFRQGQRGQLPDMRFRRSGPQAAEAHLRGHDPLDPRQVAAFQSLVRFLRERGIHVAVVSYPVTEGYRLRALELGDDPEARKAVLAPFAGDPGVHHFDFTTFYAGRPTAFLDGDHLSGRARLHFTAMLGRELQALGWLPEGP